MANYQQMLQEKASEARQNFLTAFAKWQQSEVSNLTEDLARVKAVAKSRFGIDQVVEDTTQDYEDALAEALGVE